jgi:SAM-dependent methyltransferase
MILPPKDLRALVGDHRARAFVDIGNRLFERLVEFGGLRPTDKILDMGCGSGRLALPLLGFLSPKGSYAGVDVNARAIAYCSDTLSPLHANASFLHADVRHHLYNSSGRIRARDYRFPFADGRFTYVLLISVFSHMHDDDIRSYLKEIRRVLTPRGRLYLTMHLRHEKMDGIKAGILAEKFTLKGANFISDGGTFAYEERYVRSLVEECGFVMGPIAYCKWKKGDYRANRAPQEHFVLRPA